MTKQFLWCRKVGRLGTNNSSFVWKVNTPSHVLWSVWNDTQTKLKILQYNWLMRTYITPLKVYKYTNDLPDTWFKCRDFQRTFIHCIWECVEIQTFWREVIYKIKTILCFIVASTSIKSQVKEKKSTNFSILQAKWMIAINWKKTTYKWCLE